MHDPILVFDIGGTSLRGSLYCPCADRLLKSVDCSTPHFSDFLGQPASVVRNALFSKMKQLGEQLLCGKAPERVSVAFPGPINARGQVLSAPTVWGRAENLPVSISQEIQLIWPQSKIMVLNDVSAAGYNYVRESSKDLCVVTVSSGIGHKVFIDGKPVVGQGGHGGEIGHWRVDYSDNAPVCECGHRGHLGALASGRASQWQAQRLYAEDPGSYVRSALYDISPTVCDLRNKDLVDAFHHHDRWSVDLIDRLARPLGQVLAGIHLIVGIERFVLIGGFALALGNSYRQLVGEAASSGAWDLGVNWESMIELGDAVHDAGLIGAGRYACKNE